MILGLDISTSITGATIMHEEKIIESTFWDTRNKKHFPSIYHKSNFLKNKIENLKNRNDITNIYVEQSLHSFRSGFSSAQTLSTLSRFNGIVSWICWELFSIQPEMIAATSARKHAGLSIKRGENAKQKVLEFILDNSFSGESVPSNIESLQEYANNIIVRHKRYFILFLIF